MIRTGHGLAALLGAVLLLAPLIALAQGNAYDKLQAEAQKDALRDLERGDAAEQVKAAARLGPESASRTVPVLTRHLADRDPAIRLAAASTLWTLAGKDPAAFAAARPALESALDDSDGAVAMNAAGALSAIKVPAEALAPARRRVLQQGNPQAYVMFLAARGLIGIEPGATLVPALFAYLEQTASAAKRGGARENLQLAISAMERLADTQDRAVIAPLQVRLAITNAATAYLLPALDRFKPKPDGWTKTLLEFSTVPDKDLAKAAWVLLGRQDDAASLASWAPVAASLVANPERRDFVVSALGNVAGRTKAGLPELAALAVDPGASEEQRLRAIAILGNAADGRGPGAMPEVNRAALDQWLRVCEPIFSTAHPGKPLEACQNALSAAVPDGNERARLVTKWLVANPDAEARVWYLGRLEGLWSEAFLSYDTVRGELNNSDPRVRKAAENALDRIRPAWRESGARQEKQAAAPAKTAPAAQSGPGADGAALYAAIRVGDLAAVKKLVTRNNVLLPVHYPQVQAKVLPLGVAINYCGIPTVTGAQLAAIVQHMVSMGADPEAKDPQGANLFDRAKQACPPEVVKALSG